jgi:hypothetical protein
MGAQLSRCSPPQVKFISKKVNKAFTCKLMGLNQCGMGVRFEGEYLMGMRLGVYI